MTGIAVVVVVILLLVRIMSRFGAGPPDIERLTGQLVTRGDEPRAVHLTAQALVAVWPSQFSGS